MAIISCYYEPEAKHSVVFKLLGVNVSNSDSYKNYNFSTLHSAFMVI